MLLRKDEEIRSKELGDGEFKSKKSRSKEEVLEKVSILLNYLPPYSSTTNVVYFVLKVTGMVK